jgi:hypothetical protein
MARIAASILEKSGWPQQSPAEKIKKSKSGTRRRLIIKTPNEFKLSGKIIMQGFKF